MAYTYDTIFAADPSNTANVAANASITIFNPADATKAPIAITDVTGVPLANPITVNKNGFGPAFQHATLDRVGWFGAGFTGYFTSYEGLKAVAVAAQAAAEAAGTTAGAAATASLSAAVADADSAATAAAASATAAANAAALVGAPADSAVQTLVNAPGSATRGALNATYASTAALAVKANATDVVPKWKATTAYLAGDKVLSPAGDIVSAKVDFTSGASYNAANWNLSASYLPGDVTGATDGQVATWEASSGKFKPKPGGGIVTPKSLFHGVPVISRAVPPVLGTASTADGTYRTAHRVIVDSMGFRLLYSNVYDGDNPMANDITVSAAVENGGLIRPVTFNNGSSYSQTVLPGAIVLSDPVATIPLVKGDAVYVRTYVTTPGGTGSHPKALVTRSAQGEGFTASSNLTVAGSAAVTATNNTNAVAPIFVGVGKPSPVVGLIGDSITYGTGDTGNTWTEYGWAVRGINDRWPYLNCARAGETGGNFTAVLRARLPLLSMCSHIVSMYGTNDFGTNPAMLATTVEATLVSVWQKSGRAGAKVYGTTLPPRSTGTWAALETQTTGAANAERILFNTWIRDGAPVDATFVPVATGSNAAGTLRAGQAGHPLAGWIETADLVESSRNSGLWKISYTADGIHPNTTGHVAMSAAITAGLFV